MKLKIYFICCIQFLFAHVAILIAQPYIADQDQAIIYPKAAHSPAIDGVMDAIWYNVPRYPMTPETANYAAPEDWYDMSGEWRAMWDSEYLYVLVDIRDEMFQVGLDWNWDSIELYSDPDFSHLTQYDGANDVQLRFHLDDNDRTVTVYTNDQGPEFFTDAMIWEQEYTYNGWRFEVALPATDLYFDPEPGLKIGTECQYNDNDQGTATEHKLIAFGSVEEHWGNPSLFGAAILSGWTASDTLIVMKTNVVPTIDGVLDPVWHDVPPISASSYISFDYVENFYDLSMTFRSMWDENYLYYFVTVWDDVRMRDGAGDWEDDGVEIYFDGDYSHGTAYDQKDDYQFAFSYENTAQLIEAAHLTGSSVGTAVDVSGILQAAQSMGDEGFTLEIAFPIINCLGITPAAGHVYGIEVDYNDDDDGGTRDTKLKTYAETDDTWENPGKMVPAILVTDPSVRVNNNQDDTKPAAFFLGQNYPNPFNPSTTIRFAVADKSPVLLTVYDLLGRKVATPVDAEKEAGLYTVTFDAGELVSGVYVYTLQMNGHVETKKMVLLH